MTLTLIAFGFDFSAYHQSVAIPYSTTEFVKNIFLYFPDLESTRLIPPSWALTVELFFYICIGIGLSKNRKITVAWLAVSAFYHLVCFVLGKEWYWIYFSIFGASLPFSIGAVIYHFEPELTKFAKKVSPIAALLMILIPFNWYLGKIFGSMKDFSFYLNLILNAVTILSLINTEKLPMLDKKKDKRIGNYSYPIYLVHYLAGFLTIEGLLILDITVEMKSLPLMFLSIPLLFSLSFIIIHTLESNIERLRNNVKTKG